VENGRVVERRSMMRAGTISDIFWGLLNTLYCFFHCMISVRPPCASSPLLSCPISCEWLICAPVHARWI